MKLIFTKIIIHNFMSFGDQEFNFDDYKGMTRVKGKNFDIPNELNGAGKSNMFSALVYGLYGETPTFPKLKNENVCNRYLADKNTKVTVFFTISNTNYKIVSGFKGKQSICELYKQSENGVFEDITRSTIAETRKYLERDILHCDMNLFMRTIYLNSDPKYNFYNLKEADRKEFIDKLFDISIFGDMYAVIHSDVKRLEKDITAHQNRLIVLNKNADEYSTKGNDFIEKSKTEIESLKSSLESANKLLAEKKNLAIKKNDEIEKKYSTAISKIADSITEMNMKRSGFIQERKTISHNISMYSSCISDRKKILDKHSELKNKLCDDCKPIFSGYYNLDKYQSEIDSLNTKIENEKTKDNEIVSSINSLDEKIKIYSEKLVELKKKLSDSTSEYDKNQSEIHSIELNIAFLESRLSIKENEKNPYSLLNDENKKQIEEENVTLETISSTYKYAVKSQEIVDQENLKKFIIRDMVGLLNDKIKYYIHKLGFNCDIVFDDNMKVDFVSDVKSGIEFNNFSKGEQARISIATCFAFRDFLSTRSRITSNMLILDEFFDSNVDPMGIESTMDILKKFVKNSKQKIYVVSHRLEVNDESFHHIIQVEKKDNISKINVLS